ncbi:MAG: hypothetical protein KDE50_01320 [Caldilineaceae bacterium]|nr:hypothetical protein [Nitrospira sp.]MCB0094351.1 hypothetical protein [Caldilineaceae bacterium]MCB0138524.1 hypothetical protein [Caldilineaceae bacterium]
MTEEPSMNSKQEAVMRILRNVYTVQDDDIQCDIVAEQMMHSADALHSDEASQKQFPAMWRHFQLCVDCYNEYRLLMELVEAEAAHLATIGGNTTVELAELPAVKAITALPNAIRQLLANAFTLSFPGFTPMLANSLRGTVLTEKPIQVTFPETRLQVELNVLPGLMDSSHRLLTCEILASESEQSLFAADMVAQLWSETSGELEQEEEIVDKRAAFDDLYADRYTLLLITDDQTYGVMGIDLANI